MTTSVRAFDFRSCLLAGTGVSALLCSSLAYAQQTVAGQSGETAQTSTQRAPSVAPASDELQEVIVTAEKRQNAASNVPMSITAVTGTDLEERGVKDLNDLTRVVPGFVAEQSGFGYPIYYIRGIGYNETSLEARPAVTAYMDEVPYPLAPLSMGAPFDVQQVEVLKGPQGTLFGQNSTGGAINFIANKPTNQFEAGADVSYGRFNDEDLSGFVSGPLTDDLKARFALRHESADPWQYPYGPPGNSPYGTSTSPRNGAKDFTQGRLILDWDPTDRLKVEFNGNGFVDHGTSQAAQYLQLFPQQVGAKISPGFVAFPSAPQNDRAADGCNDYVISCQRNNNFAQGNLRVDYSLSDNITLTSLTSWDRFTEDYGLDLDGTPYADDDYNVTGNDTSIYQELRLAGSNPGQFYWTGGVNFEHDSNSEIQHGILADGSPVNAFNKFGIPNDYDAIDLGSDSWTSAAIFGNIDYNITDNIIAHAGARYTDTHDKWQGCTTNTDGGIGDGLSIIEKYSPGIPAGQCVEFNPAGQYAGLIRSSLDQSNVSWRTGLDWKPTSGTLLYANASRGFKSGGFPVLGGTSTTQYIPVTQEEVTAYEVGEKLKLLDNHLQLNGAVFYDDYRDKQLAGKILSPVFGTLNAIINIPKSYVAGAEIQATWKPDSHWNFNVGGTYLQTKVVGDYFNYTYSGAFENFNGAAFPYTPKWIANADGEYDWELSSKLNAFAGSTLTYHSKTNSEFIAVPLMAIDSYTLLDLRTGVATKDGHWRFQLAGYNVTDKYYWTYVGRIGDAISRLTGMPATFNVSASYRFN